MEKWHIYTGSGNCKGETKFPSAPTWRTFSGQPPSKARELQNDRDTRRLGFTKEGVADFQIGEKEIDIINAAIYLRRPLLVTGKPGIGKTSLAYAIAHELDLGSVLRWSITTRTMLQDGLYSYDAIGRLQAANLEKIEPPKQNLSSDIGEFIRLGALGTALLPAHKPRVLLIDEIDKSDVDLPNDLLHILEDGEFKIPELVRLKEDKPIEVRPYDGDDKVSIQKGTITCKEFPLIIMSSNGERDFPPAFLRRCLRLDIKPPSMFALKKIIETRLGSEVSPEVDKLIEIFLSKREKSELSTDQLLNAVFIIKNCEITGEKEDLIDAILRSLTN